MGWLDRFRRGRGDLPSVSGATSATVDELRAFLESREGVEGYLEPATAVYAMTLLLVAGDGEYLRRAVKDERSARKLCADHGVPVYEARQVGYPRRMKEYERGIRQQRVSLEDLPPLDVIEGREE